MTFQEKYSEILSVCENEINLVVENLTNGIELQEPLKSKVFEVLYAPSKHIRPLVSILLLKANGFEINRNQILYQSAIELVHNASLIHDDIIDESLLRRNVKTLNSAFDNKLAVIAGDYLLSKALDKVIEIGSLELVKMFSETLAVMTQGEVVQQFSKFQIPSIDDYIEKSYKKTAKLFETAVCGSFLVKLSHRPLWEREEFLSEQCELRNSGEGSLFDYKEFAKNFGIAFQIRDDLINCKTSKSDIKDGIYTAPVIFSGGIEFTDEGIEKTKVLLNNYIDNAMRNIENIQENEYKIALKELLGLLKYE